MPTKIIVLGDTNTGKSSLVHRFCFASYPNVSKTIAIDCTSRILKFNKKLYKIQFWDVAGGPQWQPLYPKYIKNANIAVIVYDVTDCKSFENTEKWIKLVRKSKGSSFPIIIIANKIDKQSERIINTTNVYDNFDNIFLIETSAYNGTNCTDALKIIISLSKEIVTTTVEKPWYYKIIGL